MKRNERNWIAMLLLGGVAIFFMACEKEGLGELGEPVLVHFSLSGEDFGASEVRGMSGREISETVIVPLDGEYCIYATLAEDTAATMRATLETIPANRQIRIVAYNQGSTTPVANAVYRIGTAATGEIVPVTPPGLTVPAPANYDFVAYSLNSTTAPTYSTSTITVSQDDDLLWGKTLNVPISAGGANVTIGMTHKFSQVKVSMTSANITPTAAITNVTDVKISPSYTASLTVASGAMGTSGAAFDYGLPSTFTGTSTLVANVAHTVFTHTSSPVLIKVGAVKVGATTYADKTATFDMSLAAGKKYTLEIDFKRNVVWAGSNIYWDTGRGCMTFDAPTTDVDTQRKNGLLFRIGSLVGIGPLAQYYPSVPQVSAAVFHIPVFISTTNHSWSVNFQATVGIIFSWENIPFTTSINGTEDQWKAFVGDICRYISANGYGPGGAYRLPTYVEWGEKSQYSIGPDDPDGWRLTGPYTEEGWEETGTKLISSYVSNGDVVFPLSGSHYSYQNAFRMGNVGLQGLYNGFPNAAYNGFYFTDTKAQRASTAGSTASVRCVKAN